MVREAGSERRRLNWPGGGHKIPSMRALPLVLPLLLAAALQSAPALSQEGPSSPGSPAAAGPAAGEAPQGARTGEEPAAGTPAGSTDAPWRPRTPRERELAARYGDHHVAVVGDQLITLTELMAFRRGPDFEDPAGALAPDLPPLQVEEARMVSALEQMIRTELKIQGGQNQGYDPELIQRANDAAFEGQLAARGGSVQLSTWLQGFGLDANSFKEYLRKRLLAQFWEDAVTGRSAGATGRPYVDSFVRPGTLHRRYNAFLLSPDPAAGEQIGRIPAMVSLRRLVISAQKEGSVERARALANASRDFLLSGNGTFDSLVAEYAPEDLKGPGSRLDLAPERMAAMFRQFHPGAEGEEFLASAAPGDLSPVLVFEGGGGPPSFIVYRLEGRSEGSEALPFVDLGLQTDLREATEEERRARRIDRGLSELVRSTHVAPLEIRRMLLLAERAR